MSDYAPIYMQAGGYDQDGPDVVLGALTLSASTFAHGAADNTAIGNILGGAGGIAASKSIYTLISPTDGSVKIVGAALKVGPTATPAATTIPIVIQEDNQYAQMAPRRTSLSVVVS